MELLGFVMVGALLLTLIAMAIVRPTRRRTGTDQGDGMAPWLASGGGDGADCSTDAGGCDGGGGGGGD